MSNGLALDLRGLIAARFTPTHPTTGAAERLQAKAARFCEQAVQQGGAIFKALMRRSGMDCGRVRLPQIEPGEEAVEALWRQFERDGVTRYFGPE
jgi:hypothetical protein